MKRTLSILVLLFFTTGCGAEFVHQAIDGIQCEHKDVRCEGTQLQVCNYDQAWESVSGCHCCVGDSGPYCGEEGC